jgi:putative FmdB family regulatory protein
MPIYAFECGSCGHQFDRLQRLSDADPTICPECGAEQVRRQLTAPSFRLAGAGWYETDFKKDGDKKRNLVDKAESPVASAPAKVESKPESKPEPKASTPAKPESKPAAKSSD